MYGTAWKEDRTQALVLEAIATGFRAFDTANQRKHYVEEEVGAAVRTAIASGTVTQEDQLWSLLPEQGFRHSSGLGQADWETWRAMEDAVDEGLVGLLGISNVSVDQLDALLWSCADKACVCPEPLPGTR
jgi:diketogulonate reductase-like aldo/keto reductase